MRLSNRITSVVEGGSDGWEVHYAARARAARGEQVTLLTVGDHDFTTPQPIVNALQGVCAGGQLRLSAGGRRAGTAGRDRPPDHRPHRSRHRSRPGGGNPRRTGGALRRDDGSSRPGRRLRHRRALLCNLRSHGARRIRPRGQGPCRGGRRLPPRVPHAIEAAIAARPVRTCAPSSSTPPTIRPAAVYDAVKRSRAIAARLHASAISGSCPTRSMTARSMTANI